MVDIKRFIYILLSIVVLVQGNIHENAVNVLVNLKQDFISKVLAFENHSRQWRKDLITEMSKLDNETEGIVTKQSIMLQNSLNQLKMKARGELCVAQCGCSMEQLKYIGEDATMCRKLIVENVVQNMTKLNEHFSHLRENFPLYYTDLNECNNDLCLKNVIIQLTKIKVKLQSEYETSINSAKKLRDISVIRLEKCSAMLQLKNKRRAIIRKIKNCVEMREILTRKNKHFVIRKMKSNL